MLTSVALLLMKATMTGIYRVFGAFSVLLIFQHVLY